MKGQENRWNFEVNWSKKKAGEILRRIGKNI
jgi:hypothetical protein